MVFEEAGLAERLASLPIERMWGSPRSLPRFKQAGLNVFETCSPAAPTGSRTARLLGLRFHAPAHGRDDRAAAEREASIGQERTFAEDIADSESVEGILLGEVVQVAERLRRSGSLARTVTLKIRFGDFQTITRSRTMPSATDTTSVLWETGLELFTEWSRSGFQPVRLIGFSVSGFETSRQATLFEDPLAARASQVDAVTDAIHARFGGESISRARAVRRPKR